MKTAVTFYTLEDGVETAVNYTVPEQFRNTFYNGITCSERTEPLDMTQEDTFYLIRNCLNGILYGFRFRYFTSKEAIESQIGSMESMVLMIFILGAVLPPLSYAFVVFFALSMKNHMTRLMNGLSYLSDEDAKFIGLRIAGLKRVFSEATDEKTYQKLVSEDPLVGRKTLVTNATSKKKAKAKAAGASSRKNSSKGGMYFRLVQVFLIYLAIILVMFGLVLAYFVSENKQIQKVSAASNSKETVKTQYFEESHFYSVVISYIGTNGTSDVLKQSVEDTLEETLDSTTHTEFIEDYLVNADELKDESQLYNILDQVENYNICETILKDVEYCELFGDGVFTQGFSKIIQYVNTGLRAAIEVISSFPSLPMAIFQETGISIFFKKHC